MGIQTPGRAAHQKFLRESLHRKRRRPLRLGAGPRSDYYTVRRFEVHAQLDLFPIDHQANIDQESDGVSTQDVLVKPVQHRELSHQPLTQSDRAVSDARILVNEESVVVAARALATCRRARGHAIAARASLCSAWATARSR